MNNLRQDILKTLAYFDYFKYPLTNTDIRSFLPHQFGQPEIDEMLFHMMNEKIIFKMDNFYSLQNDPSLAKRRREGNERASKQLLIAKKVARLLSYFPYIEAIAVSGSLSKYFADEKADIDFFIITSANRLWIARTFTHFLKKLSYLAGKQNWLCMNYYVDEMGMEIPEKNIFTAMEIVTLLPMEGLNYFKRFIEENSWANNFFPAHVISLNTDREAKRNFIRKFIERIFNSGLGDVVDTWLMNLTDKRWKKKTASGKLNDHGVSVGMLVNRHFSKPNPKNFQQDVVEKYYTRINKFSQLIELQA